jgi:alkylation response protein AidB-like acyl-CoA dehydrogenase
LAAPTLLHHGTEEQIAELVRAIALGEAAWCQLFSEPGSGSDLASVATRAVRDGDEWVVTGQKVWNSGADSADFGMLLARTDPSRPKHRGITYFAIDMHQPGIEVRPLRQMNGLSSFCEVFLTEARVPAHRVIGAVDDGWQVAQTTLFHERNSVAGGIPSLFPARSGSAG